MGKLFSSLLGFVVGNKLMLMVAGGLLLANVGQFLWNGRTVAKLELALEKQKLAVAVEAAQTNAKTIADMNQTFNELNARLARFEKAQQEIRDATLHDIREIENVPADQDGAAAPVLRDTMERLKRVR